MANQGFRMGWYTALLLVGTGASAAAAATRPAVPQPAVASPAAESQTRSTPEASGAEDQDPANLTGEHIRPDLGPDLPADQGAAGLALTLRKLATRASLLMIVAHPDDEDGGMLTYESRGLGARVGMLTLTRGEGGQNLMSADFNDALGLVRTRELLAADRFFAIDQLFGTEVDFGFSKTIDEAFTQWTHQRVLYDAVRAVRLYRPLVLTAVFIGAPSDGHGQHQVSGEIAQEVFTAAADPKLFPEMGLPPWAPARVYGRVPFAQINQRGMFDYATSKWVPTRFTNYVTGKVSTTAPATDVTIPEGDFSKSLGKTYVQFAREGLALQRSQIGSSVRLAPAGAFDVGYTRYGSRVPSPTPAKSFFDGIDTSLPGIASLAATPPAFLRSGLHDLAITVAEAQSTFHSENPAAIAPLLRAGLLATDHLIAEVTTSSGLALTQDERFNLLHELRIKRVQFNHALALSLGLTLEAQLSPASATNSPDAVPAALTPGQPFSVTIELTHTTSEPLTLARCTLRQQLQTTTHWTALTSTPFCPASSSPLPSRYRTAAKATVPPNARGQRPPFARDHLEQPFYTVADPALRNAAATPPALIASVDVAYGPATVHLEQVVGQEIAGAFQPATVVPAVNVSLSPEVAVIPRVEASFPVTAHVSQTPPALAGSLRLLTPPGWTTAPPSASWSAGATPVASQRQVTPKKLDDTAHDVQAVATVGQTDFRESFHAVGYPGLIRDVAYQPARTRVQGVDLHLPPNLRVAYLPGTGDTVEAALRAMGIATTQISVADITAGHLTGYDAVVLGVRAYAAHPDLQAATPPLLAYAQAGGTVVTQYNTTEYTAADAPFPLSLGTNERVVEERDPVHLLTPEAQVLRWPNRITEHDFDGWLEERGHGFMGEWAPQYTAPTEVHDPGEDPQRGGLLTAPVGRGTYVYCAFALYRQLPEGVPGAYRLLANLVSLGRKP